MNNKKLYDCRAAWRCYVHDQKTFIHVWVMFDLVVRSYFAPYERPKQGETAVLVLDKHGYITGEFSEGGYLLNHPPTFQANSAEALRNFRNTTEEDWIGLVRQHVK